MLDRETCWIGKRAGSGNVLDRETLLDMQSAVHTVFISDAVYEYILSLVTATRNHPYIERGASPRGTIAMVKMAKASA